MPNKNILIIIILVILFSFQFAIEAIQSDIEANIDKVEIPLLHRSDIYEKSWAVIIGINKYQHSEPLKYAVKDAKSVKDILIHLQLRIMVHVATGRHLMEMM